LAHVQTADRPAGLRHALEDQHPVHHRIAGEMPGKERLVVRHVLDADARFIAADGDNAVHQQERITLRQELEEVLRPQRQQFLIGIVHLAPSVPSLSWGRSRRRATRVSSASRLSTAVSRRKERARRPGVPSHFAPAGTSLKTEHAAPIWAPSPMVMWSMTPDCPAIMT